MKPRVSVVIPTYRRPALLKRCLAALGRQNLPGTEFEIVVVHDGPSPAARRRAALWCRRFAQAGGPRLRYLEPPHRGPAGARNTGWRAAAAEIVAFTDDDTVPDPDWLSVGLDAFTGGVDAAWGAIAVPLPSNPTDYELDGARLAEGNFVTANCFCRKRILETIGGFDERFERAWREDSDLYFRLLGCGARVVHVPRARVAHPIRPASWGVSVLQQRKVLYDALLFKKHRDMYRRWIQPAPRWDYYSIVAALGGAAVAAPAGATPLAVSSGMLWLILTARFCLGRLRPATKRLPHVVEMVVTSVLIPPVAVFWRIVGVLRYRVLFL